MGFYPAITPVRSAGRFQIRFSFYFNYKDPSEDRAAIWSEECTNENAVNGMNSVFASVFSFAGDFRQ